LKKEDEKNVDKKHDELLRKMLGNPKTRSFAGWLWEALFAKKCKQANTQLTIVGSVLPCDSQKEAQTLLQINTKSVHTFDFDSFASLEKKAREFLENRREDFCIIAKAESDTFEALDAILLQRNGITLTIAGLQLTVAARSHPVNHASMVEFFKTCRSIDGNAIVQLWFLQPEQSLSYSQFVNLQPMVFCEPKLPSTAKSTSATKKRKMSNNKDYWEDEIKSLQQFVGIVCMQESTSDCCSETGTIQSKFKEDVSARLRIEKDKCEAEEEMNDPLQRSFCETMRVMSMLEGSLSPSLYKKICNDISADRDELVEQGFVFKKHE